jgi:hypothetical protein
MPDCTSHYRLASRLEAAIDQLLVAKVTNPQFIVKLIREQNERWKKQGNPTNLKRLQDELAKVGSAATTFCRSSLLLEFLQVVPRVAISCPCVARFARLSAMYRPESVERRRDAAPGPGFRALERPVCSGSFLSLYQISRQFL